MLSRCCAGKGRMMSCFEHSMHLYVTVNVASEVAGRAEDATVTEATTAKRAAPYVPSTMEQSGRTAPQECL